MCHNLSVLNGPVHLLQEREDPTLTDWDRFARTEYVRLAMEEEGEGDDGIDQGDGVDVWDGATETSLP